MYRNRLIPCLLLSHKSLFKTVQFKKPRYIGDPINTVKLFSNKEVDELIIVDFTASVENRGPDIEYLKLITSECFMPLCYGGGVTDIHQVEALFKVGIEKIAFNTSLHLNPNLIREAVRNFGSQSIIASIDVKKTILGKKEVFIKSGKLKTRISPKEMLRYVEDLGVGEVLLTSIDHEGLMQGYDHQLIHDLADTITIPLIANGGAGSLDDCNQAIKNGASAAAAGSLFIYYGKKQAVLVNYPRERISVNE
nr:AglZ/HisF2 family acetamidino modification protein [uncultured Sphaerochaeta sp.]